MKKHIWPRAIIAVYVLFAATMAGFVTFAMRQPSDLVTKDYYRDELNYQQHLDSARRADASTVQVQVEGRACELRFPADVVGTVQLYRPSDATLDRTLAVAGNAQHVDLAGLVPGLWRMRIDWKADGKDYFKEQELVLNP